MADVVGRAGYGLADAAAGGDAAALSAN